ncbi:MAG: glycosyltransferase [Lactobacillus sp.]|nr:glycosyltransferase [Lactobacillus sp.]
MKILCFTDGFNQGGAERQLIGLANLLQQHGFDVTLASYHKENFYRSLMDSCNLKYDFIESSGLQLSKLVSCYKYFKTKGFDCVISYKGGCNQICCLLKAIGMSFKLIVSERCLVYDFNAFQKRKFFLYRFADYIVPNSYAQEKFIGEHYPKLLAKTVTITNFTDIDTFVPVKNETHSKLRVLVTARISHQKNIKRFIEALSILKKENLSIDVKWFGNVNFGEDTYALECKELIERYGIGDIFHLLPATTSISTEYQSCDVFCLPSIFEGYPNVVCEAMSCGKPVLCSNVCDNSTIVEDGVNGYLFDPYNIMDIVQAFRKVYSLSTNQREEMGTKSREMAVVKFSKKTFVNKYIKLIEK